MVAHPFHPGPNSATLRPTENPIRSFLPERTLAESSNHLHNWTIGACVAALLSGCVSYAGSSPPSASEPVPLSASPPENDAMRLHFIDVGQGSATLVEFPCGAMLVDTGGEEDEYGRFRSTDKLSAYLTAFFARRTDLNGTLDVLLLTHPHIDHIRGAETVLKSWKVKNFVENGQVPLLDIAQEALKRAHDVLDANPGVQRLAVTTDAFPKGGAAFSSPVLDPFPDCKGTDPVVSALWGQVPRDPGWGEDDYGKARFSNENNHSVATRIDFGASSLLITGDMELAALRSMLEVRSPKTLDVDMYSVGHHGSANGTTAALLDAMTPEWAILQMGPHDRHGAWTGYQYGHPRRLIIDLLQTYVSGLREPVEMQAGNSVKSFSGVRIEKAIYATGWDGNVVLDARADGKIVRGFSELELAPAAQ